MQRIRRPVEVTIVLLVLTVACSIPAHAITYYVAASGSDLALGITPLTPWKTIDKVNAAAHAGDTVLFNRGDVFRGQIEVAGENMTYGAYGVGAAPVISGSRVISGWSPYSGNIYVASVGFAVKHLFVDGKLMTIARYPNTGWLHTDVDGGPGGFTDAELAGKPGNAAGYWNGATLRIRTYSWRLDIRSVASYAANGALTFDQALPEPVRAGWGYYLDGKLSELDTEGEWFYDVGTQQVYLYAPGGVDPDTMLVEGMSYDVGIHVFYHKHGATIQDLAFRHQAGDGIVINQSDNVTVRNCAFNDINETAIQGAWNSRNNVYENNTITNVLNRAITFNAEANWDPGATRITGNVITNTAMVPGYAQSGQESVAIHTWSPGVTINNNRIEHTGYNGIQIDAPGCTVEGNYVDDACAVLNDGGALWLTGDNNTVRNNFLLNTRGNLDGSGTLNGVPLPHIGAGIYFMSYTSGNIIDHNVVAHNSHNGIYIDWGDNNVVTDNVLFDNKLHQLQIRAIDDSTDYHQTVTGNVFFSMRHAQVPLFLSGKTDFGDFDDNFYYNPFTDIVIIQAQANDLYPTPYSLARWKSEHPLLDQSSHTLSERYAEYVVRNPGANLVENGSFNSGIAPWHNFQSTLSHDTTQPQLDGGSLKVQFNANEAQTWPTETPLIAGQFYAFDFSAVAQQFGAVHVLFYDETTAPQWTVMEDRFFSLGPARSDHRWVFQAPRTTAQSRPWFFVRDDVPVYWLDNVRVTAVDAKPNDVSSLFKLVLNPSPVPAPVDLGGVLHRTLLGAVVSVPHLLPAFAGEILMVGETPSVGGAQLAFQSADQNHDNDISLAELLRIIQFYNSPGIECATLADTSEDGFLPSAGADHDCIPHSTDYNPQDWKISLGELLRVIQFYNSAGYHYCPEEPSEDGFCPGAPA